MNKRKKIALRVSIPIAIVVLLGGTYGVLRLVQPSGARADRAFAAKIQAQTVWQNTLETRIPLVNIYQVMLDHMMQPREDGKTSKLLFIGFDGALATAVGMKAAEPGSTLERFAKQGGLWLGQTGGAVVGDQPCVTAPGWGSIFTGVWADVHGVRGNEDTISDNTPSIMTMLTRAGLKASFSYSWESHGKVTYKNEAAQYPDVFRYNKNDEGTESAMLAAIESGEDAVFGTLEYCDHAGHASGYSTKNAVYRKAVADSDAAAGRLIAAAQASAGQNEDWLIIITTDHGGYLFGHYNPTLMESTSFFASNKPIFGGTTA